MKHGGISFVTYFSIDIYSNSFFVEFFPKRATKESL